MPTRRLGLSLLLCLAFPAAAQPGPTPAIPPALRPALDRLQRENAWTLGQQAALCAIPAPPFGESARADAFAARLRDLGVEAVRSDAAGNVIGTVRRNSGGPHIVLSAHLDTVFPEGTDVTVSRDGATWRGPGIADNCRGLAVVLAVVRALEGAAVPIRADLTVVGTVGEEGLGNLRGVRHLFTERSAGRIDYFVAIDGGGLTATTSAVGSHRYQVTFSGPGGHSFSAFGMPNPIHALGRAIALLAETRIPASPKTTFNVGEVRGGTSVNAIAMEAAMTVDLRSESQAELDRLDRALHQAAARALQEERARWPASTVPLEVAFEDLGKRPAGTQPDSAWIVRVTRAAGRALGFDPVLDATSSDANIPMSLGVPAVTLDGGGEQFGSHSLSERYEDGDRGWLGPQWVLLLLTMLTPPGG